MVQNKQLYKNNILNLLINFVLILALLASGSGCSGGGGSDDQEALEPKNNACDVIGLPAKVINGTPCGELNRSPVVRLVMFRSSDGLTAFCSGVMIAPSRILTAAHCFQGGVHRVVAVVGDSLQTSTQYEASGWNVHPGFQGSNVLLLNDVAVVQLAENLTLPVLPLLVSTSVEAGDIVSIFGYGTIQDGTFTFEELRSGEMKVAEVTATHIRADFKNVGSNTCVGDSGGPLIFEINGAATIAGLTSTGERVDCLANDRSYFANIQAESILSFLQQVAPDANYF